MKESQQPAKNKQYHIQCGTGDLSPYVLLPGDPERVEKITSIWDTYDYVASHREYTSVTGIYKNVDISCISTGIGAPSAGIAVEELARIGCHTLIRVGSTGVIQDIPCGDLIISTGAVRFEGSSEEYIWPEYPAMAHFEVVLSLIEACEKLGFSYHLGIGATTDSFYAGQARSGFQKYFPSKYREFITDLQNASVLNFDMETACILTLSSIYKLRAGAVYAVFANRVTGKFKTVGEKKAGKAASEAVKILHKWDQTKKNHGKKWFYPSLIL